MLYYLKVFPRLLLKKIPSSNEKQGKLNAYFEIDLLNKKRR